MVFRNRFTKISEVLSGVIMGIKPAHTFKSGKVEVSAWQNQWGLSFTVRKNYFDKNKNEWKSSQSFFGNELHDLASAIEQAIAVVERDGQHKARKSEAEQRGPPPQPAPDDFDVPEDDDDIPF